MYSAVAWDEGWEVDRYQEEIDRSERERMAVGWDVPGGWARPADPVCKRCWYVLVDGECVGCVVGAGQQPGTGVIGSKEPAPRSESAYGEGEAA